MLDRIREIENVFIPMPDGVRLAARLFLPADSDDNPVPAILEYIPYRKRDLMRARDEPIHRYFAAHGYASVRVDVRGSGDSDGLLEDEYSPQELADALDLIAWISAQPWCSGPVGMMGISWGGFNALQVASLGPPELEAIITLCSTDDRYADDAHYMGGCLLNENMQWGSILTMNTAYPPDPDVVGERWRDMWLARIDALEPFAARWMSHPWRTDFWKHGSVCEDYDRITTPVYAIGGWADGYSNAVPRLVANLSCPRKGLIGPWAHNFPHDATPGPSVGFLQEAVRWWDHWLKGRDTGIMDEPVLRAWMQEWVEPQPQYEDWPGRWVGEDAWPSPRIAPRTFQLDVGNLADEVTDSRELSFRSPQTTGLRGGEWCGFGVDGEMPPDQRPDDGGSLVFDSDPLDERIEVLGAPVLEVEIASDRPVALLAARLCDVAPDGSSLRVSYGLLNLCQRDSREAPEPLEPGRPYRVRLQLNDLAHAFAAGHRIRLALSSSYWPIAWPSPEPAALTVRTGISTLTLPARPPRPEDGALREFEPPEAAPGTPHTKLRRMPMRRSIEIDLTTNEMVYTLRGDGGELAGASLARIEDIDLEIGYVITKRYRILEDDPLSAQTELVQQARFRRGDWTIRLECRSTLRATRDAFQFDCDLEAFEGEECVRRREFVRSIPRKLV
ncbi:MAG: CocE/NonD family hydrolase [Gammaproteobacteria bacterium]|nr:CocE/NonD family hydrolase [Gammaproteobacteria bacterium]